MQQENSSVSLAAVRLADAVFNALCIAGFIFILAYGLYGIWDYGQIAADAGTLRYAEYKPAAERKTFAELQALNPDVIGWIQIYGTTIDYPLVQGSDDWEYINKDAEGNFALSGSIFLHKENNRNFTDYDSIIFGHNMMPEAMFGAIRNFAEADFFNTHRYGDLYCGGAHHGLEIFEMLSADAYDGKVYRIAGADAADRKSFLEYLRGLAIQKRDAETEAGTDTGGRIVLLSTCSDAGTNSRNLLAAWLTDTVFPDSFSEDGAKDSAADTAENTAGGAAGNAAGNSAADTSPGGSAPLASASGPAVGFLAVLWFALASAGILTAALAIYERSREGKTGKDGK